MTGPRQLEAARLRHQAALDAARPAAERNKLGQFATPPALAEDIARTVLRLTGTRQLDLLEPSCGTGALFSALLRCGGTGRLRQAVGIELDERYAAVAADLWGPHGLKVIERDFTDWVLDTDYRADLLVANPPYTRYHSLPPGKTAVLQERAERATGIRPSGLAGLYVHFVLLAHQVLAPGAVSAWLIPSEFLDTNYGQALKQYLRDTVTTIQIHRFNPHDVQFADALVTSAVVVFRNTPPGKHRPATAFTQGGSVHDPATTRTLHLSDIPTHAKWSRCWTGTDIADTTGPVLGDLFKIHRGISTGSNQFFIRPRHEIRELGIAEPSVQPILPPARRVTPPVVEADPGGWPANVEQLGLLGSTLPEDELRTQDPALWAYLHSAPPAVRNRATVKARTPWYRHEPREPSPFLCTYMGRGVGENRPFRFIRNHSNAIATNSFLMLYPAPELREHLDAVHEALLGYTAADLRRTGRVYGGGLYKTEPNDLARLPADRILATLPSEPGGTSR